jgi:penicillin-binding protein-related factor A (putative recombinase)
MTESDIQAAVHRALNSRADTRVFRNHVGNVQDSRGRWHRFGLQPGSADLIGWCNGIFLSVEIKTKAGRLSAEQINWMDQVRKHGGIAFVARSAEEAIQLLNDEIHSRARFHAIPPLGGAGRQ